MVLAYAEVSDFDVALVVEEDVVEFDVSVQDVLGVDVADAFHHLFEEVLRHVLRQLPPLPHI